MVELTKYLQNTVMDYGKTQNNIKNKAGKMKIHVVLRTGLACILRMGFFFFTCHLDH